MMLKDPVGWSAVFGAGLLATVTLLPQAHGELVYDETDSADSQSGKPAPAAASAAASSTQDELRVEDRRQLRQALGSSEKAQATMQGERRARRVTYPAQVVQNVPPPQTVVVAPATEGVASEVPLSAVAPAADGPVENLSKTDLMRRERVREEIKNEDVLQERLEQLRLRDERRRTQQLLGAPADQAGLAPVVGAPQTAAPVAAPAPVVAAQEEAVVAPVTEHPGETPVIPVVSARPAVPGAQSKATAVSSDDLTTSRVAEASLDTEDSEKTKFSFRPYAGLGHLNSSNPNFDVSGHYAVGVGLGIGASDNVTFEVSYTYANYGVQATAGNASSAYFQTLQTAEGVANPETLYMHQNVFDAGLKISLLGPDSKIRPYVGGGGAYTKSYINYSDGYANYLNQTGQGALLGDYATSSFLGYLSAGLDVRASKTVSFFGEFRYHGVLSSSSDGTTGLPVATAFANDADKIAAGASFSQSSFYGITGGVSFVF